MLVLALGDAYIPERASQIPDPIAKLLVPRKFDYVVGTGNVSNREIAARLAELSPKKLIGVPGVNDVPRADLHTSRVFKVGEFSIGVVSSFEIVPQEDIDALGIVARRLDADILLYGGSHKQDVQNWDGRYFVNPGSLTGAPASWSAAEDVEPAGFCLLDIQGDKCTAYMYRQDGETVKVNRTTFTKGESES